MNKYDEPNEILLAYLTHFGKSNFIALKDLFHLDINLRNQSQWNSFEIKGAIDVIDFLQERMSDFESRRFKIVYDLAMSPNGYAVWLGYSITCPFTNSSEVTKGFLQYITVFNDNIVRIEIDNDFLEESIHKYGFNNAIQGDNGN